MMSTFVSAIVATEKNGRQTATVCVTRPTAPLPCRKAVRRRPGSDVSRDAAPGLPAESVGAGRTGDSLDVSQQAEDDSLGVVLFRFFDDTELRFD